MNRSLESLALVVLMIASGGLAWMLQMRPALTAQVDALTALPLEIADWRGESVPMDPRIARFIEADVNIQRLYRHATGSGDFLWLYVGYYGTASGGRGQHTPRGCYTGAGWDILATGETNIDARSGLRATEYVVQRGEERRLVLFYYRSHRRTGMLSGIDQNLDRMVGLLVDGRADGALVRISAPIGQGGKAAVRERIASFARALEPVLADAWPDEQPVETS